MVNRANTYLVFMDGKSKTPIRKPGNLEAAISHMRKSLAAGNIELEATDHDYHVSNFNTICQSYMRHTARGFRLILLRADLC